MASYLLHQQNNIKILSFFDFWAFLVAFYAFFGLIIKSSQSSQPKWPWLFKFRIKLQLSDFFGFIKPDKGVIKPKKESLFFLMTWTLERGWWHWLFLNLTVTSFLFFPCSFQGGSMNVWTVRISPALPWEEATPPRSLSVHCDALSWPSPCLPKGHLREFAQTVLLDLSKGGFLVHHRRLR